jgi:Fic family protein
MSFIETQRHGNHDYYYLVKNVRTNATTVKKHRIFLGREIPPPEELRMHLIELEKQSTPRLKTNWLQRDMIEKLDGIRATLITVYRKPTEAAPKDFLVRYTYNTNAIEGNRLTLRQTALLLSDRVSPAGARTDDVIEALNAADAWDLVQKYTGHFSIRFLRKVQYEVTKNTSCRIQGDFRDGEVRISGSSHIPPNASEIPRLLDTLVTEIGTKGKAIHPVELAAYVHNRLVNIHPFTDGNGRTARLIMNWMLIRTKFPPVIVEVAKRESYYNKLEKGDKGDHRPFALFLGNLLIDQYTKKTPVDNP